MATLELCDLCGGKVKRRFLSLTLSGQITQYEGSPPPPPVGFKYRDEEDRGAVRMVKTWDSFGNYLGQVEFMDKPPKYRDVRITYDLCEGCAQKMMGMLETLRGHYHTEQKEIEFLDHEKMNPWKLLGFDD